MNLSSLVPASTEVESREHVASRPCARIVHLTSVHASGDVRIFAKECRSLAQAGYEVTLVAPHDRAEVIDGVRIEPVARNGSRRHRMTVTFADVWRKAMESHADIYHFHDPELLPLGVALKIAGKHVVYDAHENLAQDILTKDWISARARRIVSTVGGTVEHLACKFFDAVVAATPAIANLFPAGKTVLVQNYPRSEEFLASQRVPFGERENKVLYLGGIETLKGAREMVGAMARVPKHLNPRLLLVGQIAQPALATELSADPGWCSTEALGFQSRSAIGQIAGRARVGLVLFHPAPNYDDSQPNKLFEYMAAGLPVIASNFPHWRELVDSLGCGLTVDPLDKDQIAEAITSLLENPAQAEIMGKRGQDAVRSTYNWKTQQENLLQLYQRILH